MFDTRLVFALLVLFPAIHAGAQQPLPAGADAYTSAKFMQDFLAYELRVLDEYKRHTRDAVKLHQDALGFLTAFRRSSLGFQEDQTQRDLLYEKGEKLLSLGSEDPLIVSATAIAAFEVADHPEAYLLCQRAIDAISNSPYGPRQQADTLIRCQKVQIDLHKRVFGRGRRKPRGFTKIYERPDPTLYLSSLVKWMAAESKNRKHQRFIWNTVENHLRQYRPSHAQQLTKLADAREDIDPWLLEMLQGYTQWRHGWHGPGRGRFASDASKRLTRAAEHFERAWKHEPRFPEAPTYLITSARDGFHNRSPRYWFDQAVAGQLDYRPAYTNLRTALRPAHGGSVDDLLAFGIECSATERYDTFTPFELLESLWAIQSLVGNQSEFWRRPGIYQHVRKLCQGASAAPIIQGELQSDKARSIMAANQITIGALVQHYDDIASLWDQTDEENLQRRFHVFQVADTPSVVIAKARFAANGHGDLLDDFEQALAGLTNVQSVRTARGKLDALRKESDSADVVDWLTIQQAALDLYETFYDGKWAEVRFPEPIVELSGARKWQRLDERTVVANSTYPMPIDFLSLIPIPFEFEVEIETSELTARELLAGVLIGDSPGQIEGLLFGLNPAAGRAGSFRAFTPRFVEAELAETNLLHVRVWNGQYEIAINGQQLAVESVPQFSPSGYFAFWIVGDQDRKVSVAFRNLRIRKVNADGPSAE